MQQEVSTNSWADMVAVLPPVGNTFDATANDSDKTFTVPYNQQWKLNFAHVELVSSADVGNRQMVMNISDSAGNLMLSISAGAVQAASLTREYHFVQGTYRETAFVDGELQVPFGGDIYLKPGWTIRIFDKAAIAATADDMTVAMQYLAFNV